MPHSTEYEFKDLSITVAGIRLDTYFEGTAELAEDEGYEFYVKSILLDGRKRIPTPILNWGASGAWWSDARLLLERGAGSPEEQSLFKLISEALYADEDACEYWRSEREAA